MMVKGIRAILKSAIGGDLDGFNEFYMMRIFEPIIVAVIRWTTLLLYLNAFNISVSMETTETWLCAAHRTLCLNTPRMTNADCYTLLVNSAYTVASSAYTDVHSAYSDVSSAYTD